MIDREITHNMILDAIVNIGKEAAGHEIFEHLNIDTSYDKERVRIILDQLSKKGYLIKMPIKDASRSIKTGNRGSAKWYYKIADLPQHTTRGTTFGAPCVDPA